MQGTYADPLEVETFFHHHCRSWLDRLPGGVRSGLPATDQLQVAVEPLREKGRAGEAEAGSRVRARLGLPQLAATPGGFFSLSHSHGSGLCLGVRWNGARVGVDVERADRTLNEAVRMRVAAETVLPPLGTSLTGIQVWCLKEAAFKSCPWNEETTLAQYWLEGWDADQRIARVGFPPDPAGRVTGTAWATVVEIAGIEAAFAVGVVGMRS